MKTTNFLSDDLMSVKVFGLLGALMLGTLIPNVEMKLLVLGIFAVFALVFTLISPLFGLCLVAFSIPFAGVMKIVPGVVTANKLIGGLVAISLVFYIVVNRRNIDFKISKTMPIYLLLTLLSLPSLLWSSDLQEGLEYLTSKFFIFGLALLVSIILRNETQLKIFCAFAAGGAALLGMYVSIFGMGDLVGEYGERLAGGTNENVLAHALAVGLLLSGFLLINTNKTQKVLVLVLDVFILVALGLTGSRGTWLALLVAFLVFPIVHPQMRFHKRILSLGVSLGMVIAFGFGIANNIFGSWGNMVMNRINELTASSGISSFSGGRIGYIWPMYLDEFIRNPLFGGGYEAKNYIGRASHNDLLNVMIETGIVGLLIFLLLVFMLVKESFKCEDSGIKSLAIAMLCFLFVAGIAHNTMSLKSFALAIGVLFCLPLIYSKKKGGDPEITMATSPKNL